MCEFPRDGGFAPSAELSGAFTAPVRLIKAMDTRFAHADLARFSAAFGAAGPLTVEDLSLDYPARELPTYLPDALNRNTRGAIRIPDGGAFVLRGDPPYRGHVEVELLTHEPCSDCTQHRVHGCALARYDEELPDGGDGPRSVYLRLRF